MTTSSKTDQLQIGSAGFVLKVWEKYGVTTILLGISMLAIWRMHTENEARVSAMLADSAAARVHLEQQIGAKLDKLKREVRREHGCKVNVSEDDE